MRTIRDASIQVGDSVTWHGYGKVTGASINCKGIDKQSAEQRVKENWNEFYNVSGDN